MKKSRIRECTVCLYMKAHPDFKKQILESNYFTKDGEETMMEVVHRWGDPFIAVTMYAHFRRHMRPDMVAREIAFKKNAPLDEVNKVLEGVVGEMSSDTPHERALDEFINKGRILLTSGDMSINAATFLKAVQLKMDKERATKDRGMEAFKMMSGAFKQKETENDPRTPSGA